MTFQFVITVLSDNTEREIKLSSDKYKVNPFICTSIFSIMTNTNMEVVRT